MRLGTWHLQSRSRERRTEMRDGSESVTPSLNVMLRWRARAERELSDRDVFAARRAGNGGAGISEERRLARWAAGVNCASCLTMYAQFAV